MNIWTAILGYTLSGLPVFFNQMEFQQGITVEKIPDTRAIRTIRFCIPCTVVV
ncbi:hypothetical protein EH228_19965 [Erwinia endophytica]|nr:hypothetical protein EH228_19965 [Erwinia endophytica]